MKKTLAFILTLCLLLTMIPAMAFSASAADTKTLSNFEVNIDFSKLDFTSYKTLADSVVENVQTSGLDGFEHWEGITVWFGEGDTQDFIPDDYREEDAEEDGWNKQPSDTEIIKGNL